MFEQLRHIIYGPELPSQPKGKLTKGENKAYREQVDAARRNQEEFFRTRRNVLFGIGGTLGLVSAASIFGPQILENILVKPEDENYDGSIEQTRYILDRWNNEVGKDIDKLLAYTPRLTRLADAYYSRQMSALYPDLKEQFKNLSAKVKLLSPIESTSIDRCGPVAPGFVDNNSIYLVPEEFRGKLIQDNYMLKTLFLVTIHEFLHASAPVRTDIHNIFIASETEKFYQQTLVEARGLKFGRQGSHIKNDCGTSYFRELEEMAVEDATTELVSYVSVQNIESAYIPMVLKYRAQLPNTKERWRLFRYQQTSDLDGFLASISEGTFNSEKSKRDQILHGSEIVKALISH